MLVLVLLLVLVLGALRGRVRVGVRGRARLPSQPQSAAFPSAGAAHGRSVSNLFGRGFGTRETANELHLSIKTIETHRAHIKEKLGFKDGGEMVRFAIDWVAQEQGR